MKRPEDYIEYCDYLQYLYRRAKQGATTAYLGIPVQDEGLSPEELKSVLIELRRSEDPSIQSEILEVLRYAGAIVHDLSPSIFAELRLKESIAQFLSGPDSALADTALSILCDDWRLIDEYAEELIAFMQGAAWDYLWRCQIDAMNITGEYLARHAKQPLGNNERRFLQAILDVYEKGSAALSGEAHNILRQIFWAQGSQDVALSARNRLGESSP